ncbi:MAG: RNA polymerase subunit sigma-54 [Alphaproteobacteria bacterium]|mgnify:CR=1 FL=1|nr:RNA polymerase subunit sigma-54 [Alphaproteobacteria bacterium]|tara:strand:- start:113 stop:1015 length:903 start_codon:yes stop_codon:yes gene_type:complete
MNGIRKARPSWLTGNLQGMGWMLTTAILIVTMHTLIRHLAADMHPFEIGFFRTAFGAPVVAVLLWKYGWGILRTDQIKVHGIRSVGHVIAMMMFFTGLAATPLATANALAFTAPLFAAVLAVIFLGEVFRWRRWAALLFGFAGTLAIIRPGFVEVDTGPILIIAASAIWGVILIVIKSLSGRDATPTIVAYMVIFMTPLSLIPALFVWTWPTLEQLGMLLVLGMMGTIGHLTLTQALRVGEAAVVMPMDFFKLIWAAALGFLIFGEIPDIYTWIGGVMIFVSATYLAIRERAVTAAQSTR